ncbi:calcium-binding protein P-like isoform X1 [Phymastichus coffea]|uniref:calcium-binding protein P-like isoform X1 n=1 Tax=Phymastichus coffea TaxID=108790 RepID=UPI00273AE438|nr:calcium-binding protein P-like isoform X1 [Phymastichus coffea]
MKTMNVAVVLAIVLAAASAAPYSKFGRSCQDIGCRSDEKCIMAEEPCSYGHQRDQCGRYPTCQRINSGGESCTTKICSSGQYCRTENGRPTCVNTNAGLAEDVSKRQEETQPSNDPKPSAPLPDSNGYPETKSTPRPAANYPNYPSASNSGYPAYPDSHKPSSPSQDHYGYPAQSRPVGSYPGYPSSAASGYPSSNNNYGYPSYPTQDSSRRTSATTHNAGYPSQSGYPGQAAAGYPGQAGSQNPYNNPYAGYRPQQQGPYQGGYYPPQQNGYPNQGYDPYGPPTTKKPSFTDRIANYAKNVAKQVLTQALIDKVSGRS